MIHKMNQNPSFSSTLLDQIYRSISENDDDLKFYNNNDKMSSTTTNKKKQTKLEYDPRQQPCSIDKWIDHKVVGRGAATQQHHHNIHSKAKKSIYDHRDDLDHQDAMFFSSTSISSDSSSGSGGFSSSDTDSIYAAKSKSSSSSSSCSALPNRPKPVRTTVNKTEKKKTALFYSQRELEMFGDYHSHCNSSSTDQTPKINESIFKSKSRALKIYNKVKQPISPGGKLANFINSIFTSGNSKKSKNAVVDEERKFKAGQASTCSSASSFSRSCLSKSEKFRDGVKRNVRFYPVCVIVDEDCRPCGQKSLYEDEEGVEESSSGFMSVSLPTAWKIGSKKSESEFKFQVMDHNNKSRRSVEQVARDLLREYQKKNDNKIMRTDHLLNLKRDDDDEEDDDDVSSCASSDLFELDHLSVIGKDRYCEELPVYETTRIETNRAIANGFRM